MRTNFAFGCAPGCASWRRQRHFIPNRRSRAARRSSLSTTTSPRSTPQVGYDLQNYVAMRGIFDRLMDYRPGTVELIPSLAESYTISDDGKTYSFQAARRRQIPQWPAADVGRREILPRARRQSQAQSPGTGYFTSIAGYDELSGGKAQELSGIKTPDDHTVEISLSRPDATFLYAMSLHFASIVPREEVEKSGSDWGRKPVGSGAFKFMEWVPGQYVMLERNKDYWLKGVPYLDKITFQFGQDPTVAVLRLKNGEVDVVGDGIPPAQFPASSLRSRLEGSPGDGRLAADGLCDDECDQAALRQARGQGGGQHGYQPRPHRAADQQPRRPDRAGPARPPCLATMPPTRATPTTPKRRKSCWPRPVIRMASQPSSMR